ncbi:MAG: succinyl-diaminopimelate desuccinylase [Actinomycetes bacterium]
MPSLDLSQDVASLTSALVDVYSESGHETELADLVEAALREVAHLHVQRDGDAVVARTSLRREQRIVLGGHLDTVPPAANLPSRLEGRRLHGLGTGDMKSGVAVMLRLAATIVAPGPDVTFVFYDGEEVEAERNGLLRLSRVHPQWLAGDFAVLLEPTDAVLEGGCQGSVRVDVHVPGRRAHSARSWLGDNAIHAAEPVLTRLRGYVPREPVVEGLQFREGLNAVGIRGGVAGNVIPDECVVTINYRFAPDRSEVEAQAHLQELFDGYEVVVTDSSPAARPGLDHEVAQGLLAAVGGAPRAKFGWTDVARFNALGVPAVNYGPGDPSLSHTPGEYVDVEQVRDVEQRLRAWLSGPASGETNASSASG